MFKITKAQGITHWGAPQQDFGAPDHEFASHYCRIESWAANLDTGVFRIGPVARHHHGLAEQGDFGLLNLVRCYDAEDRQHVLELFEVAAMSASSFCFSTTIVLKDNSHIPVMCIGESSNFSDDGNGGITGVFVFPRFELRQKLPPQTQ